MLKRLIYIGPIIVLVMAAVLVGSFYLVPTDRLNAVIARQLTDAFGSNVTLSGRPSVSLFPFLKVSFGPLKVEANGDDTKPLMEVARASGRLSTTSLWEGKPALRFIDLENANIFLMRDEAGKTNWSAARFFSKNLSSGLELKFPKILKRISFVDSTLTISDPSLKEFHTFTEINATITGPPRSVDFVVKGSFMWHDALVEGSANIEKPGAFMIGETSAGTVAITSAATDAIFKGDLIWARQLRGDGSLEANVHSALDLAKWLGLAGGDILPDGPIRLIGDGIFTSEKFDFRPIGIRFQDGKADGRLELDLTGSGLGLSGTLAFDRFIIKEKESKQSGAPSFLETLLATGQSGAKLDLRISADTARVAGQNIKNMAIGLILNKPSLLMNIGAANLMSEAQNSVPMGNLSGEITAEFSEQKKKASANLTLNNMTIDALESAMNTQLPFDGNASISFQVSAEGETAQAMENTLGVKVVADIQDGVLNALNLGAALSIDQVPDGKILNNKNINTPFKRGKVTGVIDSSGIFAISAMRLEAEKLDVIASGRVDIAGNRISMLGQVSPKEVAGGPQTSDVPFTLGGSISMPRVSSVNNVRVQPLGTSQ